jgi:calcium-dependent protein kinase
MGSCTSSKKETPKAETTSNSTISKEPTISVRTENIRLFYEIREKIAEGGFGAVYSAVHLKTNKPRAIKVVKVVGMQVENVNVLLREANILKSTDHPNILKIYEVFRDKCNVYFVTELLKGGELFDRIVKKGALSENQAANYMLQMVSAVVHMHSLHIVHRDLKPENILFESRKDDASLKIIDFGTCRNFIKNSPMQERIGSSYYMAPEVITGNYSEKCDIWSLGVILYILLAGFPPFSGATDREILLNVVRGNLKFDSKCWANVSPEAIQLIKKMLTTKQVDRPTAAQVFQNHWLQSHAKGEAPDHDLAKKSLANLANFNISNNLLRVTLEFIANELVPEDEMKNIQKIFKKIDKDGDGFLSRQEIEEALVEFPGIFTVGVNEVLKKVDVDGNGQINYSEFLTSALDWETHFSNEKLRAAFKQFDKDGNGTLSIEELYQALGGNQGQNLRFLEMLKEADTNGDNEIDIQEFIAFMRKAKQQGFEDQE